MLALVSSEELLLVTKKTNVIFLWAADQRKLKVAWVIGLSKEIFLMLTSNSSPASEEELKTTPSSSTVPELSSTLYSSSSRSSIVTWHNIFTVMSCILEKISYFSQKRAIILILHGHLGILNGRLFWGKRPNQVFVSCSPASTYVERLDQPDVVDSVRVLLGLLCHGGIVNWGSLLIRCGWLGGVHVLCLMNWNNKRPLNGVLVGSHCFPLSCSWQTQRLSDFETFPQTSSDWSTTEACPSAHCYLLSCSCLVSGNGCLVALSKILINNAQERTFSSVWSKNNWFLFFPALPKWKLVMNVVCCCIYFSTTNTLVVVTAHIS